MKQFKVIISGGGTGGHIFPAISIADSIRKRYPQAKILFVGAENKMEMTRVPKAGYDIIGLPVAGFNRSKLLKNIPTLWRLQKSMWRAKKILKNFQPDIAIGVGGYASGPMLKVAASKGIPILIQEQNSYAGITNKLLASKASVICVAHENMERFFPKKKIVITGNPCREELFSDVPYEEAINYFKLDRSKKTILVVGGSLGAKTINRSIMSDIKKFSDTGIQVIWQSGKYYFHDLFLELNYTETRGHIHLFDFIDRMDLAYKVADLVITRAGASSISELSLLGKPAIFVPSPNVAEDHQTKNAKALVSKNAALIVLDSEADKKLVDVAIETINDGDKLKSLSENISKLALRDSANKIVDEVIKLISKSK